MASTSITNETLSRIALAIRVISAEGVQKAKSGHPGLPMGTAEMAAVLWSKYLRFDPKNPTWLGRDRFVLSAGHGSMLLYTLLHMYGYDLSMDELKRFRQWESKTPGHPEFGFTPGVELTTGPLGQGFANGVGLAISAKMLGARYDNDLFSQRIYGIVSDGDLMEGISYEAAALAGHYKLGNLVYLYDDNKISLAGGTDVCFTEDVAQRFESMNWLVLKVNGHSIDELTTALDTATGQNQKPVLVMCRTTIGYGSPTKAGTHKVHGEPLGDDELKATKAKLGWAEAEAFSIPADVKAACANIVTEKQAGAAAWTLKFAAWENANADKAKALKSQCNKEVPAALSAELRQVLNDGKKRATREISGDAIQIIAKHMPGFVGGSADLEPSTKTTIKDAADIQAASMNGKNFRFGVREHAMGAIANGLAYEGCWAPFTATFLVFSDYMRPTVRLAALSHLQTLFIFTHDSFWVGEDGPTHEPIEHVAALRLIPNLWVQRPADGLETAVCYELALGRKNGPSALLFTRQGLAPIERPAGFNADDIKRGAYIAWGAENSDYTIVATGSEVAISIEAAKKLAAQGIKARVVSAPCLEVFETQDAAYREKVLPAKSRKVSVEAGVTAAWYKVVGSNGLTIGLDHYGASAPGEVLAEKFGFTPDAVAAKIAAWA